MGFSGAVSQLPLAAVGETIPEEDPGLGWEVRKESESVFSHPFGSVIWVFSEFFPVAV